MNTRMLLTVVVAVACHAERQQTLTPARKAIEHPSVEQLDDDENALAAKRRVYAGYFDSLKRKVAQNWNPSAVWRGVDPQGTRYGTQTRVTVLRVSLSRKGDVANIAVTSLSGVTELDDEAVRAFRMAAPFNAPPRDLVQKDDLVTFQFSLFFDVLPARKAIEQSSIEQPPVEQSSIEQPPVEQPLDDGDKGASTANRWVYASYFNSLKRKVAQNWNPSTVWRRVDPQGTRYGTQTRMTTLRVSMSRKGEIASIVVTSQSGMTELDDEAVRAFRMAAPFTAPPTDLVQKDDLVTFQFSFIFELGSQKQHVVWRLPQAL